MEQKRKLLIKVLTKLKPYRELAEGILALIESSYVDEATIDGIIRIMSSSIKNMKKAEGKTAMKKWIDIVKKIQAIEEKEKKEEWDIDELLDQI